MALAAALIAGAPRWLSGLASKRDEIREAWGRPLAELVERERGPAFAQALDRARELVPESGSYLLLANAFGPGAATAIAVRLELLPRTAVLFERLVELGSASAEAPSAVISVDGDEHPPVVSSGFDPRTRLDATVGGVRDDRLPAAVDEVSFEGTGGITVRGWCRARGIECGVAAVLLDGRAVPFVELGREPRPDVAVAVPDLGDCSRAGYRIRVPRVSSGRELTVEVVFRAVDRRYRVYPPVRIEVPW